MQTSECKPSIWLHFNACYLIYLLSGPMKDQRALSSLFRRQRDLKVRWHLCHTHSSCTQLHSEPASTPQRNPDIPTYLPTHVPPSWRSAAPDLAGAPLPGPGSWMRLALVPLGGNDCLLWAGPRTHPLHHLIWRGAARIRQRELDRSWEEGRGHTSSPFHLTR